MSKDLKERIENI